METQVRTPQDVFNQPQRFVVPLFQRPYVWNEENQWEPLWDDVARVAERLLTRPAAKLHPHFLGAVVLQQVQKQTGQMQERTIIDGQQRLTTLQLLLDALHGELLAVGAQLPAMRIESLVTNAAPFCAKPTDRFKVWPTNRDRPAFNAVMAAPPPVDYDALGHRGERMVGAHRYFSERSREWLMAAGPDAVAARAQAVETTVRDLLQMVVIDLNVDENAQEIFETLNARGVQLTAADLIKNFVFQRLLEANTNVEAAYEQHWRDFETHFWETEVSVGRLRHPRSAIFFNHWLVARTGEEVVAREVFDRFKRYADHEAGVPMSALLEQIHRASSVYRQFISGAQKLTGAIDRLGLFGYRTGVLESEVIKPLILFLLDREQPTVPESQLTKALDVVESWMVRRVLVRATTKSYTQLVADLIGIWRGATRTNIGDVTESFFAGQSSERGYWPDDEEVLDELAELLAYRRLARGRLRMVLEALEDHRRGWRDGKAGLGEERVARGSLAIEHVMPRKWQTHWPLSGADEAERDRNIHTIGNLTLLTKKLNSKQSNGPWSGADGKREGLEAHDVLFLNRELLRNAPANWTEEAIGVRTSLLSKSIVHIWPVPPGHKSGFSRDRKPRLRKRITLSDLITGGVLTPGMQLFARRKYSGRTATLLPDGRVEVDGAAFTSVSEAASTIAGKRVSGWQFFLTDQANRISLHRIWRDYVEAMSVDAEDDDADTDDEVDG